jgi:acetolactate synthase regulatory subunit
MNGRVIVDFSIVEGAMIRMLGLVERRGFRVRGLEMRQEGASGCVTLDLEARDPARRLDVLDLQLRRLAEVRKVFLFPASMGSL